MTGYAIRKRKNCFVVLVSMGQPRRFALWQQLGVNAARMTQKIESDA